MKKVVLFFIVSMFFVANANAEVYLSAKAGFSFIQGDYEEKGIGEFSFKDYNIPKGSFEVGYKADLSKFGIRVGLEYDIYDKMESDEVNVTTNLINGYDIYAYLEGQRHSVHANFYLDFKTPINISPYIGLGVGASIIDGSAYAGSKKANVKVGPYDETYTGASIQAMLGFAVILTENIAVDFGYKLNYFIKPEDSNNVSLDLLSNDISVGLRFTF